MELTREEAIRNFREHWASITITGADRLNKGDYLKRNGYKGLRDDCFLCEFATKMGIRNCKLCPIEWPTTHCEGSDLPCCNSYFRQWQKTKDPEERKRLAAIIRDLPEKVDPEKKEEEKPQQAFKVGDRVRVKEDLVGGQCYDGLYFNPEMNKYRGKTGIITDVVAYHNNWFYLNISGKAWNYSPSMLELVEEEPHLEVKPEPKFKVGDKVVPHGIAFEGWTFERWFEYNYPIQRFFKKEGYLVVYKVENDGTYICSSVPRAELDPFKESDLIPYVEPEQPPINQTPENKTVEDTCVDGSSRKYIFSGNTTICIVNRFGKQYKGVAKCDPKDKWNEIFGMNLAYTRARIKLWDDIEQRLLGR